MVIIVFYLLLSKRKPDVPNKKKFVQLSNKWNGSKPRTAGGIYMNLWMILQESLNFTQVFSFIC